MSKITVQLVQSVGGDHIVVAAARTSADPGAAMQALEQGDDAPKLIRSLIRHKHASPFEHGQMTFYVDAPIFVWREHHRHRTWSYSEESGRYRELEPRFWVPRTSRAVLEEENFRPMRPKMVVDTEVVRDIQEIKRRAYAAAYDAYLSERERGVAPEVARSVLPVAIYSRGWATVNPRNLMNFLSLRTQDPRANHPSYPQREIEEVAQQYEEYFARLWPLTYTYWNEFGREAL